MFFREEDAISGKMAKAFATVNGRVEELFYAKSLEAMLEKNKADVPTLGRTNVGKKSSGWNGTGTLNVYYVSTVFRNLMLTYVKTGRDFNFDLQVINEDPTSSTGRQTVVLKGCNLDSLIAAKFDSTSDDMMDEELSFTFSDYDILDQFNALTGV
ncbi:phage portal protein [Paenibacillus hemerocallicola]|uniref:Phage portal protein n=1 Tax=Paenibacillus hemerocallicola TaxID=1172614 RepID=A0A5C4TI12_9BACL|nr:phage tail tube protein [Paenibacillus hemerocallicola]TNJ68227.1 phage portal protein [Paenibacillus hemerocallicola]